MSLAVPPPPAPRSAEATCTTCREPIWQAPDGSWEDLDRGTNSCGSFEQHAPDRS